MWTQISLFDQSLSKTFQQMIKQTTFVVFDTLVLFDISIYGLRAGFCSDLCLHFRNAMFHTSKSAKRMCKICFQR